MSDWRRSRPLALAIIVAFFVIQLAVPISRLGSDRAMRFGWQMFSASYAPTSFVVTTSEGSREVALHDYMVDPRVDVDIARWLPPHLCLTVPGAIDVRWDGGSLQC